MRAAQWLAFVGAPHPLVRQPARGRVRLDAEQVAVGGDGNVAGLATCNHADEAIIGILEGHVDAGTPIPPHVRPVENAAARRSKQEPHVRLGAVW